MQPGEGGDRSFLQVAVGHQYHRAPRRSQGDLVSPHGGLGEMRERNRQVVPFRVIANHRRCVLSAVIPLDPGPPRRHIDRIAKNDEHRRPAGEGVVDGHRGVLQTDGAVRHDRHGFALDLGVSVGHRYRRLFVAAGEQFRTLVPAIVDDRLVQGAKARTGIGGDVFEPEGLDDVHHEIRARAIGGQDFNLGGNRLGFVCQCSGGGQRRAAPCRVPSLWLASGGRQIHQSRCANRSALQKTATIERTVVGLRHGRSPVRLSSKLVRLNRHFHAGPSGLRTVIHRGCPCDARFRVRG